MILLPGSIMAQSSSMTDDQVMRYVAKEHQAGTSQSQIVIKLMQQGVDISQIRRVRKEYERMQKNQGLGTVDDTQTNKTNDRSRKKQR
jgi:transcriptional accessory protein Tex/SPT6